MQLLLLHPPSGGAATLALLRGLGHEVQAAEFSAAPRSPGSSLVVLDCACSEQHAASAVRALTTIRASGCLPSPYALAMNVPPDDRLVDTLIDAGADDIETAQASGTALRTALKLAARRLGNSTMAAGSAADPLRSAIDASADAITILDVAGRIVFASQATQAILKREPSSIVGTLGFDLIVEEDRPLAYALFAELAAGRIPEQDLVVRMTAGDGSLVDVEVSGRMLPGPDAAPAGLIVVTRDISARRRADADLRESQERFQRVVEASRDLIAILDPAGVVQFLSPAHSHVLGYEDADILGRPVTAIVHPDDALDAVEGVRELTQNLDSAIGEMRLRHANGDWIPFEVAASPLMQGGELRGVVTVARDLRERRRVEDELRKSEARFRQVLETTQDLISMTDEAGRYLFASPSHEAVLGYGPGELLGRSVAELFHPDEVQAVIDSFEARSEAATPRPVTLRLRHKDGSWVPIEVASSQFRDAAGALANVAVGRDVRPREAAERAVYVVSGRVDIGGESYGEGTLAVLRGGASVLLEAAAEAESRVIVIGGTSVGPRHIWWNFVSSSEARIERAKRDWTEMRMGSVPGDDEYIPLPTN